MSKQKVTKFIDSTKIMLVKHSPEILTGIGIAGMITTTILAVKATPKALQLIEEEKELRELDRQNGVDEKFAPCEISAIDAVKLCWKCYIPAAVTGAVSMACLIGASSVNARRNAALATAYKLSETALNEYREKVVETIGEKKERVVRDAVAKEKIEKNPVTKNEVIVTEKGSTLCYDAISGRYFKSDIDLIKRAVNELNRQMLNDGYISLNEFYDELGLDHIQLGYDLGWKIDKGMIDIDFSSHLAADGTPCIVVNYSIAPEYGYSSYL